MSPSVLTRKLVRDRIPQIVSAKGELELFEVLEHEEHLPMLHQKLMEEFQELLVATSPQEKLEELADLFEVVATLARFYGFSLNKLECARIEKRRAKGGFTQFVCLVRASE